MDAAASYRSPLRDWKRAGPGAHTQYRHGSLSPAIFSEQEENEMLVLHPSSITLLGARAGLLASLLPAHAHKADWRCSNTTPHRRPGNPAILPRSSPIFSPLWSTAGGPASGQGPCASRRSFCFHLVHARHGYPQDYKLAYSPRPGTDRATVHKEAHHACRHALACGQLAGSGRARARNCRTQRDS